MLPGRPPPGAGRPPPGGGPSLDTRACRHPATPRTARAPPRRKKPRGTTKTETAPGTTGAGRRRVLDWPSDADSRGPCLLLPSGLYRRRRDRTGSCPGRRRPRRPAARGLVVAPRAPRITAGRELVPRGTDRMPVPGHLTLPRRRHGLANDLWDCDAVHKRLLQCCSRPTAELLPTPPPVLDRDGGMAGAGEARRPEPAQPGSRSPASTGGPFAARSLPRRRPLPASRRMPASSPSRRSARPGPARRG